MSSPETQFASCRIIESGQIALVLERKQRRRNYATTYGREKQPKVDYRLGVKLPTGAIHPLGWYSEDEVEDAD